MTREILVVEDEPDIRSLVVLHLEREGFHCRTASTGAEALLEMRARVPDLVVLDLMLPELDGLEVTLTVIIVTHNMQQAARVSEWTGFFLLGERVEFGATRGLFTHPRDKRTEDYITGRFG